MNIDRLNEENVGGARYLLYVDARDVQSMIIDKSNNTVRSIGLKSGANWSRMIFTNNTLSLTEDNRKGGFKIVSTGGLIPKDTAEKQALFGLLDKKRFVVLVGTRNNELKVIGTKNEPAVFSVDKKTIGSKARDADTQRINFSVIRSKGALMFNADLILFINDKGKLIYDNQFTPNTTVTLNAVGKLIISGPDEEKYFLNSYTLWRG